MKGIRNWTKGESSNRAGSAEGRCAGEIEPEPKIRFSKVPVNWKEKNPVAYQPKLVSIGPYHFGEATLQPMEIHKRRAQEKWINASNRTMDDYKADMLKDVNTLKLYYPDLDLNKWSDDDQFVEQMILDGCFLIAFLSEPLKLYGNYQEDDTIFSQRGYLIHCSAVMQDLLMVENQLPYLVLENLVTTAGKDRTVISNWFGQGVEIRGDHLLDTYIRGLLQLGVERLRTDWNQKGCLLQLQLGKTEGLSASELDQFNVQFKKGKRYDNVKFNSETGILTLPVFNINEHVTSTYLNMNARAFVTHKLNIFINHARLMGILVKSTKDVSLLQSHGIIINELPNHEAAVEVIQEIARGTFNDGEGSLYGSIQQDLVKFCEKKRNKLKRYLTLWLSELYETHFKTPWAGLSLLAAIVLLALTATQTYYAVLSYKKQ